MDCKIDVTRERIHLSLSYDELEFMNDAICKLLSDYDGRPWRDDDLEEGFEVQAAMGGNEKLREIAGDLNDTVIELDMIEQGENFAK